MISKEKNFFLKLVKSERLKNLQTQKKKKKRSATEIIVTALICPLLL